MSRSLEEFRSISTLMLQRIVALAVVCLICISTLQIWWEREQQEKQFFNVMALIVESSSRSIASALWDIEREVAQKHVERLAELESVGYVKVQVMATGEVFTAGRDGKPGDVPSYKADILAPNESDAVLGVIEVWADSSYYRKLLWDSQKHVIPGYLLFTVLLCLMVAWVMQRDLGMPLRQIAEFVRNLKPEELHQPLHIQRPERVRADEIDMVMQGFHHLQEALDRHIKDLDGLVRERTIELHNLVDEVKRLSQLDALTGAYNRRAMEMRLPMDLERSERYGRPFSVIFTDIDHFKKINDVHGHAVGDAVLRHVAQRLQSKLRLNVDWMVRFGGEEFVIFMPETDLHFAAEVAQRLASDIREQVWQEEGATLSLTCSFGVAQYAQGETMDTLLKRADALLYQAKAQGRNRVCIQEGQGASPAP
ncbi:MAG: diguanylate cyclase [Comamonas sp.]|nr:diguanylate cyclase [Candidatus Comamonas equi]